MGIHVLTLACPVVKPMGHGQLPDDSATCAWDADPQEAGVLESTRRGSRLLAKTRRDEALTPRERRADDVADWTLPCGRYDRALERETGMRRGPSTRPRQSSRPHTRERAGKSPLPGSGPCVAPRDLSALFLDLTGRRIGLDEERERSAQSGHGSTVTGHRATGDFVQAPVRMEGLDLMNDPLRELEPLRARAL